MLFMVEMTVRIPHSLDPQVADKIKAEEKAYSQQLQRDGKWRHLWRVAGQYANVSIFDVKDADELHTILTALPLYPYMEMQVTALAQHSSAIAQN
ncbi:MULTISPECIES: muconolactone Delta-isomerase [unclassified Cupriavidus]|uniref:muconolactone Delta-isomerase n=1 Tax=unclassified Cupriavidus TaxID=2640874 RepID=UPI001C003051|nr:MULTISPECIES: muconolactone Delta-isomerase [unclassified Cupriavidus]MCA3182461.1 muconolactone Delta-isomerase [Cupriavidus sp.]MCA3191979.1 muconolactone Delta-isomerase [Cupriavidus sp.]MCA3197724.1 muconolactone Delta-isomerase [Cupriavidus sp.]MCA3202776.1 muconolactone Delta-isomerase [Cupriavidus sp.]MCA3207680.1 muconolactone Delta-isomerase [Cupriavidus sp.]